MTPAEGIRKLGFRRWYERQLLECHGFLVTGILSMIAVLACLGEFSLRASMRSLGLVLLIAACGALCVWSLRRYLAILTRAQRLGERSVCPQCGAYGVLDVMQSSDMARGAPAATRDWIKVRCRKCAQLWTME